MNYFSKSKGVLFSVFFMLLAFVFEGCNKECNCLELQSDLLISVQKKHWSLYDEALSEIEKHHLKEYNEEVYLKRIQTFGLSGDLIELKLWPVDGYDYYYLYTYCVCTSKIISVKEKGGLS
jgi:hypothetical protein